MAVRSREGRTRYVAFRLRADAPLGRGALAAALPPAAKLTRFDGEHGILRTTHRDRDELLRVLKHPLPVGGREVHVETLATSGTMRKAAAALPPGAPAARRGKRPS